MRRNRVGWLLAVLLAAAVASGCTQRRTVPRERQPCTDACGRAQGDCATACAEDKGNPGALEDVRRSLCQKRCKEGYESCMLACL